MWEGRGRAEGSRGEDEEGEGYERKGRKGAGKEENRRKGAGKEGKGWRGVEKGRKCSREKRGNGGVPWGGGVQRGLGETHEVLGTRKG